MPRAAGKEKFPSFTSDRVVIARGGCIWKDAFLMITYEVSIEG